MKRNGRTLLYLVITYFSVVIAIMYYQKYAEDKSHFGQYFNDDRTKVGIPAIEKDWKNGEFYEDYEDTTGKTQVVNWQFGGKYSEKNEDETEKTARHSMKSIYVINEQRVKEIDSYYFYKDSLNYELKLSYFFKPISWQTTLRKTDLRQQSKELARLLEIAKKDYQAQQDTLTAADKDSTNINDIDFDEEGNLSTESEDLASTTQEWQKNALPKADSVLKAWKLKRIEKK